MLNLIKMDMYRLFRTKSFRIGLIIAFALSFSCVAVLAVLSNLIPAETSQMVKKYLSGDVRGAAKMQLDYLELINTLFCEVNPIPVKAAMKLLGYDCGECRLPLTPMTEGNYRKLKDLLKQ